MPLFLYRESQNGKEKAINHPLYRILHRAPNPIIPAFIFKKTMQSHLLLWGNAFAEVVRDGGGNVVELWPLAPNRIRIQLFRSKMFYYYRVPDGNEEQLGEVLHIRGLSDDGLVGYSPITIHREKLGLAKASEEYRARFFANDARPGGVLTHPKTLSEPAQQRLRKQWEESHGGVSNRGRVAILEEDMKYQEVGMPPKDFEFIMGEKFTKADIAAIYGVPPYKIGLLEPGTVSFASVEQQAIDSVVDCVVPWAVCWEHCLDLKLLTPSEQARYFTKFSIQALLRGDSASRAEFYSKLFDRGVLSINDILQLEDRNTIGPDGDRRFVPLATVPLDMVDELLKSKIQPQEIAEDEAEPARLINGHANGEAK
jgi:HK97 family phage portal protein